MRCCCSTLSPLVPPLIALPPPLQLLLVSLSLPTHSAPPLRCVTVVIFLPGCLSLSPVVVPQVTTCSPLWPSPPAPAQPPTLLLPLPLLLPPVLLLHTLPPSVSTPPEAPTSCSSPTDCTSPLVVVDSPPPPVSFTQRPITGPATRWSLPFESAFGSCACICCCCCCTCCDCCCSCCGCCCC